MDSMPPLEGMAGGNVSNELAATLRSIAEITIDQRPKFSPAVHRQLVRAIACRNYSGPLHELCHLVVIAERTFGPSGFERLFWESGEASAASFRQRFAVLGNNDGTATGDAILIDNGVKALYPDGAFGIAFSRMPFLSALMEFLLSTLGYGDMDETFRAMPATQMQNSDVNALAKDLARRVYAYLAAHLPTAQSQRKFRAALTFLRQATENTPRAGHIDDDAVLAFWVCASTDDRIEGDFRSFRSVFKLMIAVRDALAAESDQRAIANAQTIGADFDNGEIDPGDIDAGTVETALEAIHERRAPLDILSSPPVNTVKFLKQTEISDIALIIEAGSAAEALPLSVLRAQIMGDVQARMTQALRRGDDPDAAGQFGEDDAPNQSYAAHCDRIEQIYDTLEKILLASLHRLLSSRNAAAVSIMMALRPNLDLTPFARFCENEEETDDEIICLKPPASAERLWNILVANVAASPDLADLLKRAKDAAKRVNRKGFREEGDHGQTAAFAEAAEAMIAIRKILPRYTACIARQARELGGWDACYSADVRIFRTHFQTLYGDR
jgi:hypothetical protein